MFISVCASFKATDWLLFSKNIIQLNWLSKSKKYKDVSPDWNKSIYLTNGYRYFIHNYPKYIVPWVIGQHFLKSKLRKKQFEFSVIHWFQDQNVSEISDRLVFLKSTDISKKSFSVILSAFKVQNIKISIIREEYNYLSNLSERVVSIVISH